jgi:hypothetical protein
MAQQFYNLQKASEMLGVSPADVNLMREQRKLFGYRDGSDWKFKAEDVEKLLAERIKAKHGEPAAEADDDFVVSDPAADALDVDGSGTVIGGSESAAVSSQSDIQLADSDVRLAESDVQLVESDVNLGGSDLDLNGSSGEAGMETKGSDLDLDMTLDEDLTLDDSQIALTGEEHPADGGSSGSAINLAGEGEGFDDDDLVLGGSGSGSNITIGGDSGISLTDPRDSGLSLDDALELPGAADESLELGEDDMLSAGEAGDAEAPTDLEADDDFLLTPIDEAGDDDSESGSQVIALDPAGEVDDAPTMVATGGGMAAMLDEDVSVQDGFGPAVGGVPDMAAIAVQRGLTAGPVVAGAAATLPETPYGALWTTMLVFCVLFLGLCGMMSFDIVRNIWSWQGEYTVSSFIMDSILGFLP